MAAAPRVLAPGETETKGSPKPRPVKPAWVTSRDPISKTEPNQHTRPLNRNNRKGAKLLSRPVPVFLIPSH